MASPSATKLALLTLASVFSSSVLAGAARGAAYGMESTAFKQDTVKLLGSEAVTWYYNWGLQPTAGFSKEFVPMVHSAGDAAGADLASALAGLPASSTRLLAFNEPDIPTGGDGGSFIDPRTAAQLYVSKIVPLRDGPRKWKISQPVVSSSQGDPNRGLGWLAQFNDECDKLGGCPFDFVAVHYFGPLEGLDGWAAQVRAFYKARAGANTQQARMLFTEIAIPSAPADVAKAMLVGSAAYLEQAADVDGFAWFGDYRTSNANAWVGAGAALFDGSGAYTAAGKFYAGEVLAKKWTA